MSDTRERKAHAIVDPTSRFKKADKIRKILQRRMRVRGSRILDIGAGSGHIAEGLRRAGAKIVAVDQNYNLDSDLTLEFRKVDGVELPFENDIFDIVIYNHVIEHVGDRSDQVRHLGEISRVLREGGFLYCAVPNKWSIIEPHYRLPFLSWLPQNLASRYVRAVGKHSWYDCRPLSRTELNEMLNSAGFFTKEITDEVLEVFLNNEINNDFLRKFGVFLSKFYFLFRLWIPTLVFLGQKNGTKSV